MKEYERLISVLIPVYNAKTYLKECIDSILNQTYRNIEVILIDDGSTDGSGRICDAYAVTDARLRVIHKENSGVVDARRTGVQHAKGAYCVCVDADDWISMRYIETINKIIVEYEPDMVCCGYIRANGLEYSEVRLGFAEGYYSREKMKKDILPYCLAGRNGKTFPQALWAKVIKTDLCRKMLSVVERTLKYSEDLCSIVKGLYESKSIYILDKCMYFYRNNLESVTNGKKGKPFETIMLIEKTILNSIDITTADYEEQLSRRLCMEIFFVLQSHLSRTEQYRTTARELRQYLRAPYIQSRLCKCHFPDSAKWTMVKCLLRHKIILPIYMYTMHITRRNRKKLQISN